MRIDELIEKLKQYPPETIVIAYDGDAQILATISGFLFNPSAKYLADDGENMTEGPTLEICTD